MKNRVAYKKTCISTSPETIVRPITKLLSICPSLAYQLYMSISGVHQTNFISTKLSWPKVLRFSDFLKQSESVWGTKSNKLYHLEIFEARQAFAQMKYVVSNGLMIPNQVHATRETLENSKDSAFLGKNWLNFRKFEIYLLFVLTPHPILKLKYIDRWVAPSFLMFW